MGFEPTTFCLGSKHSTTELRPLNGWQPGIGHLWQVCHRAAGTARGGESREVFISRTTHLRCSLRFLVTDLEWCFEQMKPIAVIV